MFVCRGYSKTLGAQSWRLGYAVSHPDTIKELMSHHDPIYIRYLSTAIQHTHTHTHTHTRCMC